MKIILCLILLTGSSIGFPQYGPTDQVDTVPQVEEISQKEVIPDLSGHPEHDVNPSHLEGPKHPEHPVHDVHPGSLKDPKYPEHPVDGVHPERLKDPKHPEHPVHDVHPGSLKDPKHPEHPVDVVHPERLKDPKLPEHPETPEDIEGPEHSDFNKEHQEKLTKYWWKVSGIFGGSDKDSPSGIEPGLGVGGPFTPQQSKFCKIGFDCVPWESCVNGFIVLHGQTVLQQRIRPTNYETTQCGQEGNICCGIPEEILAVHQENVGTIDILDDKIETDDVHVPPQSPVDSVSSNVGYGESYDPLPPIKIAEVREDGHVDTSALGKPVETVETHKPVIVDTDVKTNKEGGKYDHIGTGVGETPGSSIYSSENNAAVGGHGALIPSEGSDPFKNSAIDPGYDHSSPLVGETKVENIDEIDACGHASYKCVPYFQCVNGVINVDGIGLIDVRIKPQSVCRHPDFPDVPGVCCQKPGYEPTSSPLSQCPNHQDCVPLSLCNSEGDYNTDGRGQLNLRTGHKKCHGASGEQGVCCNPPTLSIETCPENSVCVSKLECSGQALNDAKEFISFVNIGRWTHCSKYSDGVCCKQSGNFTPRPGFIVCPGKSKCVPLGIEHCSGQAIDENRNIVDYTESGFWLLCDLVSSFGICCIPSEPVILDSCPGNSKCMSADQCSGQALDGTGSYQDYVSSGSWSYCSLGIANGICCIPQAPIIREICPEGSKCVLGNTCTGQALDGFNNFIDYVPSGSWTYCSLIPENGICCKTLPAKIIDDCPLQSVCLRQEQCIGKAMDAVNNFVDFSTEGVWTHCSEYAGGVCCQNPDIPQDPGYLQPSPLCGIRNYNIDERITSSKVPNEAAFGEFPWQSIIFYQNFTYVCGATLVSNKFVVTAAHCVDGIKPQDLQIRFGEWIISSNDEILTYVDRNVYRIHIHPDYNPKNVHKDFSVIELQEPIEFQYHINSVCIPNQGYMVTPYSQCFATGWGKDSFEGSFQSTLKKIDLPFIDNDSCQNLLRRTRLGKYFRLDRSFNCAGGEENKDACYGDGGGPLVCKDKASSQYQLIGITSWGIGCGQKDIPGVYANVPEYSNWINSIIKVQDADIPPQYKESFVPFVDEVVPEPQVQGYETQPHADLQGEELPEQVKETYHRQPEHIESIPEQVKETYPHQPEHIESIPEQVKDTYHHQPEHIESIPEQGKEDYPHQPEHIESIPEQGKEDYPHQPGHIESIQDQVKKEDSYHQPEHIESSPEQVKEDYHQQPGHIASVDQPSISY